MKLAITFDETTNSVYQHFGEAKTFLLYDTETKEKEVISNGGFSHKDLVPYLQEHGVDVMICGGIGNHAVEFFKAKNIRVIPGAHGNVDDVISSYEKGTLISNQTAIHQCSHHH